MNQLDPITHVCLDGVGKMGAGMAERWRRNGITVTGYDHNPQVSDVKSLEALVDAMPPGERVIWLMLPLKAYESTLDKLFGLLVEGDILIDGGNTPWRVTQQRHARFSEIGVHYVDVGTSGGIFGLENGYAVMVGATDEEFEALRPILEALKPEENGLVHAGPSGAGHFVKQVHNGMEYGIMAALGEGFSLMSKAENSDGTPLVADPLTVLASLRNGSIIASFLLNVFVEALSDKEGFSKIEPVALDSGEGLWTLQDALILHLPIPVIAAALMSRWDSQGNGNMTAQAVAAMRHVFGGHDVVKAE